jgi:hypothetical protein
LGVILSIKSTPLGPLQYIERDLQSGEGAKGVLLFGIAQCPRKFGEGRFKCSSFKRKFKKEKLKKKL